MVRTSAFQAENRGSTPRRATASDLCSRTRKAPSQGAPFVFLHVRRARNSLSHHSLGGSRAGCSECPRVRCLTEVFQIVGCRPSPGGGVAVELQSVASVRRAPDAAERGDQTLSQRTSGSTIRQIASVRPSATRSICCALASRPIIWCIVRSPVQAITSESVMT